MNTEFRPTGKETKVVKKLAICCEHYSRLPGGMPSAADYSRQAFALSREITERSVALTRAGGVS